MTSRPNILDMVYTCSKVSSSCRSCYYCNSHSIYAICYHYPYLIDDNADSLYIQINGTDISGKCKRYFSSYIKYVDCNTSIVFNLGVIL